MVLAVERAFEVAYGFPFLVGKVQIRAQGHRFIRVTVAAVNRVAERFELGYGGYDVFPAGVAVSRLSVVVGVSSGNGYFRGGNFFAVAVKVFIADFATCSVAGTAGVLTVLCAAGITRSLADNSLPASLKFLPQSEQWSYATFPSVVQPASVAVTGSVLCAAG